MIKLYVRYESGFYKSHSRDKLNSKIVTLLDSSPITYYSIQDKMMEDDPRDVICDICSWSVIKE